MTYRSLHVITSDARRGAETFAVELVRAITVLGGDARVVALSPSASSEPLAVGSFGPTRRSISTLRGLRQAAREVDVVVAHGSSTLEACALGLAGTNVPFVYRTIGDPTYWVSAPHRRLLIGAMLHRACRHVVLWPEAREQLVVRYRLRRERIDVIANAVPEERFPLADRQMRERARETFGVEPRQFCLAYVGALSAEKDVGTALSAIADGEALLLVAGDGPHRSSLERQAAEIAPGRVQFLGAVRDPHVVYAAADLLVLPSRSEGMPGVIIEAGLTGTAAVATAVGAVPDMIDDGRTGFLVPPRDVVSFVARVREASPHAEIAGQNAAREFRERYTMMRIAPMWLETFERAFRVA